MADSRLDRLARVWGVGERGAFAWDDWAALDGAIRKFLRSRWPEAAAAYTRTVVQTGMDRRRPVSDREWLDFMHAVRRCLWLFPEAAYALVDGVLDPSPCAD